MQSLFQMAENWLDVPFRWHGMDKNGCDCAGLVIGIMHENGIIPDNCYNSLHKLKYGTNLSKINYKIALNELNLFFKKTSSLEVTDLLLVKYKNSLIHFIIHERHSNNKRQHHIIHITQDVGKVFKTNFDTQLNIVEKFRLF